MMMNQTASQSRNTDPCIFPFDKKVSIVDRIDTDLVTICIRTDGIMHTHTKVKLEISLEDAQNIYETSVKLGKGKAYANLFTTEKFTLASAEVREFLVSPKRIAVATADAFILDSLPQKILGNFYLKFDKPPIPSKLFTDHSVAIKWLKQYVIK